MTCGSSTPTPAIQVNNVCVNEGQQAVFTVALAPRNTSTTINLSLLSDSATVGTSNTNDVSSVMEYYNGSAWVPVINNTVTIAANVQSFQIRTQTVNDTIFEGNEQFKLRATANGATATGIGTIKDNDSEPIVKAVSSVTVTEGQQAIFTIDLTNTSTIATNVQLNLASGTASVGSSGSKDVSSAMQVSFFDGTNWSSWTNVCNSSVSVAAGVQKFQVRTQTNDDTKVESTETFTLTASTSSSMYCGSTTTSSVTGTGTILDNDINAPQVNSISDVTVTEGNLAEFTVGLSSTSNTATTVQLTLAGGSATAGVDFANAMQVSFNGGQTWATVSGSSVSVAAGVQNFKVRIQTINDTIDESTEQFTLTASANGGTKTGTASITDNDTAPIVSSVSAASAIEGQQAVFTVNLSNTSSSATNVALTLASGNSSTASNNATLGTDFASTMQVSFDNGTTWTNASNGNNVSVASGVQSFLVRALTTNDTLVEADEKFTLTAKTTTSSSSSCGGSTTTSNVTGTGTIIDNDSVALPTLTPIAAATAPEGSQVVFTVGLSGTSTTATTVDLVLTNGTTTAADLGTLEYYNGSNWVAATSNQAVIAAGQTSVQVRTAAIADGIYEGSETFTLKATANGSTQTGNGAITDVAPTLAPITAATALEGSQVVFTVGLSGASTTATTVDLVLTNGSTTAADLGALEYYNGTNWVAATGNKAVIAAGQTSVQVRTLAVVDSVYEGSETFTLKATANGSTQTGNGAITDVAPTLNPIAAATALEGSQVVFTVGLSSASTTATTVDLVLTNGSTTAADLGALEYYNGTNWVAATGNKAVIAAGQTSVQVRTLAVVDSVYEGSETFTLKATANGSTQTGNGAITDVAPTLAPIAAATALEGSQVVFTVGLSGASTTATTVDLVLTNGSTTAADLGALEYYNGTNWVAATGNKAVIAAGQTSVQVRTLAVVDSVYEGSETFTLQATANGSTQTGNGAITDVAPTLNPIAAATALEGSQVVFTVGLSGASTTATTVDLVLTNGSTTAADLGALEYYNGTNWVAATGNKAVIAAGQTSVQVRTLAVVDSVYEGSETFTLKATANGSTQTGNGAITDVAPTLAPIAAATALEGSQVVFTVGLSSASTTATTVDLVLTNGSTTAADLGALEYYNGTNWVAATGNKAVIAAGQTSVQVRTLAVVDSVYEGSETFTLKATANGSTQTGNGAITDVAPTLAPIAAATALEGSQVVFTVGLSGASTTATTVDLVLTNGSTTAADLGALEYYNGTNWVAATGNKAVIAAGQTSVQVRTLAVVDSVYEGSETFTLQATANGSTQTGNGAITDVAPTLAPIAAATAPEGSQVVFTVGLSGASATATTVDLVLTNGTTAAADLGELEYYNGTNWVAATGNQAVIAAGQTSVQVRTAAIADSVYEGSETFTLKATANGSTQIGNGVITDVAPTLAPIAAATALEGSQVVFTVGLSGASTTATTVDLVLTNGTTTAADLGALEYLDGTNWVAATGNQAVIAAGQTSVQVRTAAIADGIYEGSETFTLKATANGSTQTGNGAITDVAPTLNPIDAATALEGSQVVFTVGLSGASTTATTVDLVLTNGTTTAADLGALEYLDGTNWVAATGNKAVIAAGQTSVQVRTAAIADGIYEGSETFTLKATANGSTQIGNGAITDVAPTLNPIDAATALEGSQVVFTVGLSGASTTATTVDLVLTNGTTTAADLGALEYYNGTNWVAAAGNQAVIAAGQTSVQVRTAAIADGIYEGSETFTLKATANGSTQTGNGAITDVAPTLNPIDAATALEGSQVVFTVGLSGASTTATTVDLVLTNGTTTAADLGALEYLDGTNWVAATGNKAVIAAGQTSVQVRTAAIADGIYEGSETFTLKATANGSTQTGNGAITDVAPTLNPIDAATALEGSQVVFTVGLSGASTTATTVDLVLTNGTTTAADLGGLEYYNGTNWVAAAGNQAVIAAGQTSVQVRTAAIADGIYEGSETFTLKATANGSTQTGNGAITDVAPTLAPIAAATALEGSQVVFTVGLSGASTTATTVDLVLTNGTTTAADLGALEYFNGTSWVAATGNQAVIAAGQTSVQVRTLAVVDSVSEGSETFTLQATANGSTQTGNGAITDVAPTLNPIDAATALEGSQVVFTVGLSGASTTATTVDLVLTNGTTTAADLGGLEYYNGTNWVAAAGNQAVIAAGQTSVQVRTLAVVDSVSEGSETFTLKATANGSTQTGNGSITDIVITIIDGTPDDEILTGTVGDDLIYGHGGNDEISGGDGNDNIFAGSQTNPIGGSSNMYGDGGDDILTGGSVDPGSDLLTGYNYLNGTNDTLLGVGEHDTLIGGGNGSVNQFYLGSDQGIYYVGGGNADYASISNFDSSIDTIQLAGTSGDYSITYTGGIAALSYVDSNGHQDLIAKIDSAPNALDLNSAYFSYVAIN